MGYVLIETTNDDEFISRSVALLTEKITGAIAEHGRCILGLSGGSTPRQIYEALGTVGAYGHTPLPSIDWSKVYIFLIDERAVPKDHPDSNQFLIRSTLLRHAPIPESNLYFPDTTLPIDECVEQYAAHLKDLFKNNLPDVVTLGLGDDGHIASLFPPIAENLTDDSRLVAHTITDRFTVRDRITLTLNPIAAANHAIFFLKGNEKKKVWKEMLKSHDGDKRWPAKRILESTEATIMAEW